MEIDKINGKLKRKGSKELKRQRKYDNYVKHSNGVQTSILREKPYALIYAEKVRKLNEQRLETQEKEHGSAGVL